MSKPKILIAVLIIAIFATGMLIYEQQFLLKPVVMLATTTSTYDSGLLDYLMPKFETKHDTRVRIISAGTGQAMEIAQRGDCDLVLVHCRDLELGFVNGGHGIRRIGIMYNDFVIIGPMSDPAGIRGSSNATEAFAKIARGGGRGDAIFISRADKSGTHMLELSIWKRLGMDPSNKSWASWYLAAGAGMGAVLRMANEKGAYALTDRGTWLSFKSQLANMAVLVQGDKILLNPYAIILVNPERHPHRNYNGAIALAKFMISEEGQGLIANFTKGGERPFMPIARNLELAEALGFPNQRDELSWYDARPQ